MNSRNSYNLVEFVSKEEFEKEAIPIDSSSLSKVCSNDMRATERLLDLNQGTLDGVEAYFESSSKCETCDKDITFYDFVFTGLVDAEHGKSFILHTLVGNKYILNKPRPVRCSSCGTLNWNPTRNAAGGIIGILYRYRTPNYACVKGAIYTF